jgi:serine/threonine-protein kinase
MSERVGPYQLEALLGQGGMGRVFRAYDERLGRRVAVKHIRPDVEATEANSRRAARFRREARTAAGLNHPHIVQIHDILETDEGDWIVMEWVEGPTLARRLRQGPLPVPEALTLGRQVADALSVAHRHGVVHRDLKAENVLLTPEGHAKIADFGLAKRLDGGTSTEGESALSVEGAVVGTYRSMAPEQARGQEVDSRADLFALGVLLYECLTGESPFLGPTPLATLERVCAHQPPPVRERNEDVPPEFSSLIDELLEKEPQRRPESAD